MMPEQIKQLDDIESDVIVIGYGGAGAVAAIAAHDAGAKVTIMEKMPSGGGATFLASGGILIPTDLEFSQYLEAICFNTTPTDVIETFVKEAMNIENYIHEIGGESERWVSQEIGTSFPPLSRPSWPNIPHGKSMVRCHIKAPDEDHSGLDKLTMPERVRAIGRPYGPDLWRLLSRNVEKREIKILFNTRAKELVQTESGEVIGVIAERQGRRLLLRANRAVILTTGGFGASESLKKTFLPCPFCYAGLSFASGDGIVMAQKAGAALWHTLGVVGQLGFKAPEFEAAFQPRAASERFIFVDRLGRRFTNETAEKLHNAWRVTSLFDPERLTYPRIPCYMIFDEVTMKKAPISRDWRPHNDHQWSLDNLDELARGWIKKGNTLGELARQLSMEKAVLENTIIRFNEYCMKGTDADFGRARDSMGPIDKPPYYALELRPMLISTQGGPAHDKESRVLDNDGKPIPRLYAAGELSSLFGWLYEAGGGHAECLVFGKIAGRNAANEKPLA